MFARDMFMFSFYARNVVCGRRISAHRSKNSVVSYRRRKPGNSILFDGSDVCRRFGALLASIPSVYCILDVRIEWQGQYRSALSFVNIGSKRLEKRWCSDSFDPLRGASLMGFVAKRTAMSPSPLYLRVWVTTPKRQHKFTSRRWIVQLLIKPTIRY